MHDYGFEQWWAHGMDERAKKAIENAANAAMGKLEELRPMARDDRAKKMLVAVAKFYYESGGR